MAGKSSEGSLFLLMVGYGRSVWTNEKRTPSASSYQASIWESRTAWRTSARRRNHYSLHSEIAC
eukprot:scaffold192658_cov50-Attheya_sp.AAC.4